MAKKKRRPEDTKTAAPDTAPPAPAPPVPGLAVAVPLLFAGLAIAFAASNAPAGLAFWNRGRPVSDLGSEAARPDPGRNLGTTTAPASTAPCSEAAEWLSPARGYHVLCVRDGAVSSAADAAAATRLPWGDAPGWRRAVEAAAGIDARVLPVGGVAGFFQRCLDRHPECRKWALSGECDKNPSYMRSDCAGACDTCPDTDTPSSPRWARQPWRAFATDGAVVTAETGSAFAGLLLLFEGGQWIWPGVSVGYNRTVVAGDKTVVLETLSMKPLVLSVGGFLGNDECDTIIGLSEPHMASSQVSLMDKDKGKAATEFRTSSTYFLPSVHPTLRTIDARVEALAHVDRTHQEFVQVLRYGKGQKYVAAPLLLLRYARVLVLVLRRQLTRSTPPLPGTARTTTTGTPSSTRMRR